MTRKKADGTFIFKSRINSYRYLYEDAESFREAACSARGFDRTRLSRTALLLYILSLEGLVNRVLDNFLPERVHDFVMEREDRLSFEDKWELVPLATAKTESARFDRSSYPWSHFAELVRLRNDYVHPKHDRPAYYTARSQQTWDPLDWNRIPPDSGIREAELVYRQTRIPKDPYAVLPEHVATARQVVDDMVDRLDQFLDGRLKDDNWHTSDQMKLIYPEGASIKDLPKS